MQLGLCSPGLAAGPALWDPPGQASPPASPSGPGAGLGCRSCTHVQAWASGLWGAASMGHGSGPGPSPDVCWTGRADGLAVTAAVSLEPRAQSHARDHEEGQGRAGPTGPSWPEHRSPQFRGKESLEGPAASLSQGLRCLQPGGLDLAWSEPCVGPTGTENQEGGMVWGCLAWGQARKLPEAGLCHKALALGLREALRGWQNRTSTPGCPQLCWAPRQSACVCA